MQRKRSQGAATRQACPLHELIILCLVVGLILSGIACRSSLSGLSAHAARVKTDLEAGRLGTALAEALTTGPAETAQVASVLYSWACSAIKSRSGSPMQAAEALVVALKLNPALEMAYRELATLLKSNPDADADQAKSRAAYESWQSWRAALPAAKLEVTTSQAGAFFALHSSDPERAAELDPTLGEAQFLAAQALLGRDPERAVLFAQRALVALGDRADVHALLAAAGEERTRDVIPLADIVVSEALPSGKLIASATGVLYVVHGGGAGLLSQVAISTGKVTRLASGSVGQVAQSPDGRTLALAIGVSGTQTGLAEIRVLDPYSRDMTTLFTTAVPVVGIVWSPDGSALAVSSGEGLMLVSTVAGTEPSPRKVIPASSSDEETRIPLILGWTTDGGALFYQRLYREHEYLESTGQWVGALFRYDLASGRNTMIEAPYGLGFGGLSFSRAGQLAACAVSTDYLQMDLHLGTLAGDTMRLTTSVAEGHVYAFPVQWSPDGQSLLVSVAPRMNDPYDPLYPALVRNTVYPPADLRHAHLWVLDRTGELSLLPIPEQVKSALFLDEGVVYYMAGETTIKGFRLR